MPPAKPHPLQPVVRIAPLGELNAYAVFEHELDTLAKGSAGAILLDISYSLLSFSGALVIAIFGTEIPSDRAYLAFVSTALITGLAGIICLIQGIVTYRSNKNLVAEIKSRMPPEATPAGSFSTLSSPPAPPTVT